MAKTLFQDVFGDSPQVKVLELLLEGREFDYSLSDIAEGAGIGRTTLYRIFDNMRKAGAVVHTRNIGNAKLFKLNQKNILVQKLTQAFDIVIMDSFKEKKKLLVEKLP